jgi:predicted DNA-binding transcriptional regulator AlpA
MQETYIPFPELKKRGIPYCRLHINRMVERGAFPAPVWFSYNRKMWKLSEVETWLVTRRPGERPPTQAAA